MHRDSIPDYLQELNFCGPSITLCFEEDGRFGMASETGASEGLAWWERAAQARRVAEMLSPADAWLAEAYAAECEARARGIGQSYSPDLKRIVHPGYKSAVKLSPKRAA